MMSIFNKIPKWLYLVTALIAIAAVVILTVRNNVMNTEIATEPAVIGSIASNIEATGTIEAKQTVLLRWQSDGVVSEVFATVGEMAFADRSLAELDLNTVGKTINDANSDLFLAKDEFDVVKTSNTSINEARNKVSVTYDDMVIAQDHYDWVIAPRTTDDLNDYLQDDIQSVDDQLKFMEFIEQFFYADMTDNNPKKIEFNLQVMQLEQSKSDQIARWNWFNGEPSQIDIDLAAGQLAVAKAAYEDAVRVYERLLADEGRTEYSQASNRVDADQTVINRASLINTIDGTVTLVENKVGDMVKAGAIGARVDDLSEYHVKLFLSEVDVNKISVGDITQVTSEALPDLNLSGEIRSIELAGRETNGVMAYEVIVAIEGDTESINPGNTVNLLIEIEKEDQALLVPTKAIRIYNGEKIVFVLLDGVETPVAIRTGIRNSEYTQVVGGNLDTGDEIILNPPPVSTLEGVIIQ